MNKDRLLKLADHLDSGQLIHKKFDFRIFNTAGTADNPCGTSGCAIGECPAIFDEWTFDINFYPALKENSDGWPLTDAETFFGLSAYQADILFTPSGMYDIRTWHLKLDRNATRFDVAKHIRKFVSEQEFANITETAPH